MSTAMEYFSFRKIRLKRHRSANERNIFFRPLSQGNSFSQKFTAAGTYDYHCAIHPSMTGKVIVK